MRGFKQFIYGILYLGIFAGLVSAFYFYFLRPAPTCFDGQQNQNETGVDCGGVCESCELKQIRPLRVNWVEYFRITPTAISLVAEVANPNTKLASPSLAYEFNVYGPFGLKLKTIPGQSFIYAGEIKNILTTTELDARDISRVDIVFQDPDWVLEENFPKPMVSYRGLKTEVSDSQVTVSGLLVNGQTADIATVKIIALLFDGFNKFLGVAQTTLNNLRGLEERNFSVIVPSAVFAEDVSLEKTKLFIESISF